MLTVFILIYAGTETELNLLYLHYLLNIIHIVTYSGLAWLIIMGSGFDGWVHWYFFTITVNYNSSHIELLLNNVCLTNPYEDSLTPIWI
jgi:hypothetical protein